MVEIEKFLQEIKSVYDLHVTSNSPIEALTDSIVELVADNALSVEYKVLVSDYILKLLTEEERVFLCKKLLKEQVTNQRKKLYKWGLLTAQPSQIDTGYIAQHLVSLRTQIAGQGMRGKGDDLSDGSEVKSANFLDSLDKRGAIAPRWNFTAINVPIMERFLAYNSLYLLTMDLNSERRIRIRIWKIDVTKNQMLTERYQL